MSTFTRILATFAIVAFSVGPVSAATVSNASTLVAQASASTADVSGTVKDDTGAPVSGAVVTLSGPSTVSATTDAKGAFSMSNVTQGLYRIIVQKAGFDTATDSISVIAGTPTSLDVHLHISTLTSLRTIATVRTGGRGTINTSTAAIDSVPSAVFAQQGQAQVTRVLNQVPGTQISLPQTSANGSVPGAITFPNIRGALSFETATLIDGHPLSVGTFGDYVTTFLNSALFQGVEVIKGPGAMAPQVNYAIGGTVNFRTKDPTATVVPDYSFGLDNHGGSMVNLGVSDTIANGRLGFVAEIANYTTPSALHQYPGTYNPSGGVARSGGKQTVLGFNDTAGQPGGTVSKIFNTFGLVACCYNVSGDYASTNELLKFRYKLSDATTATVSYLGGQTYADQNGNTSSQVPGFFNPAVVNPGVPYTGPLTNGQNLLVTSIHPGGSDQEINNEPIFQAEVRTTLGKDTLLARYYHASIGRFIYQGNADLSPTINLVTLNGTNVNNKVKTSYNNVTVPVAYYDWFNQTEIDRLSGLSFEYQHPLTPSSTLTFSADQTNSTTTSFSQGTSVSTVAGSDQFKSVSKAAPSVNIPTGSGQIFTTMLLRYNNSFSDRLDGTLSLYDNIYSSTVPYQCYNTAIGPSATAGCATDGSNALFTTQRTSHADVRVGMTYRPRNDTIVRFAMGSAIAPPYLNLISRTNAVTYRSGSPNATQTVNAAGLLPETAFGYDLGADHRFKDGITTVSVDGYLTNLYNHFISSTYLDSNLCTATFPYANTGCPVAGVPMYDTTNINLANARFEGIEFSLRRAPAVGFGYNLSGSTQRGYAYNLPPNFYCTNPQKPCIPANYNTNLAVVPYVNFTGGGLNNVGPGLNGLSNQNIPYLQGNLELNYRLHNGAFVAFGDTLYGKNNSLNVPPFGIAYASVIYPVSHSLSLQIAGDNIFNAYQGLFPLTGAGVGIPLAIPGSGATTQNVIGPATWRFILTKNIGPLPTNGENQ